MYYSPLWMHLIQCRIRCLFLIKKRFLVSSTLQMHHIDFYFFSFSWITYDNGSKLCIVELVFFIFTDGSQLSLCIIFSKSVELDAPLYQSLVLYRDILISLWFDAGFGCRAKINSLIDRFYLCLEVLRQFLPIVRT